MSPTLVAFLVLVIFAAVLVAFGIVTRIHFSKNAPPPRPAPPAGNEDSWAQDLATAARTLQTLTARKQLDLEQWHALRDLLAHEYQQATGGPAVVPGKDESEPTTRKPPVTVAPAPVVPAAAAPPDDDIIEGVLAEESTGKGTGLHEPTRTPESAVTVPTSPAPDVPESRRPAGRRALADMLQAFMEKRNIRWGELIAGLFIVGCSIGLVVSLREQIDRLSQQFVYLPVLLFLAATAAIHGAGHYTLRRWKLESTSRGILIIATLLIPINFLAAVMVSGSEGKRLAVDDPRYWGAVAIGLLAYATLTAFAARALTHRGWWRLTVAVMGTSAGQLIVNRATLDPQSPWTGMILMALPVVAFLAATWSQLRVVAGGRRLGEVRAGQSLMLLGVASFSLIAVAGLWLARSEQTAAVLTGLAVPFTLPVITVLAMGLIVHRRAVSPKLLNVRIAGTSLTAAAAILALATVGLAWPDPRLLLLAGTMHFVALLAAARLARAPVLYAAAIEALALASLLGFHGLAGNFDWSTVPSSASLLRVLLEPSSSLVLSVLSLGLGIAAYGMRREASQLTRRVVSRNGLAFAVLAALLAAFVREPSSFALHAAYLAVAGTAWLSLLVESRSPRVLAVFQAVTTLALVYSTIAVGQRWEWWADNLLEVRHVVTQVAVLGCWCLLWSAAWWAGHRWTVVRELRDASEPTVDRVLLAGLIGVLLILGLTACMPGVVDELGVTSAAETADVASRRSDLFRPAGWIAAAALMLAAATGCVDRRDTASRVLLGLSAAALPFLVSGAFFESMAVATSLRWSFGLYGLLATALVLSAERLPRIGERSTSINERAAGVGRTVDRFVVLGVAAIPVIALTTVSFLSVLDGNVPSGPLAESLFGRLDPAVSYAVPLGLLVLVCVAFALRDRAPAFLLSGSFLMMYAVTLADLLALYRSSGIEPGIAEVLETFQWNALALALYTFFWLALRSRLVAKGREEADARAEPMLIFQLCLLLIANVVPAAIGGMAIFESPGSLAEYRPLGGVLGQIALILGLGAGAWYSARPRWNPEYGVLLGVVFVLTFGVLAALAADRWNRLDPWLAYHVLMALWMTGATVLSVVACRRARETRRAFEHQAGVFANAFAVLVLLLAGNAVSVDPTGPWWSTSGVFMGAVLAGVRGGRDRRRGYTYISVALLGLALSFGTLEYWQRGMAETMDVAGMMIALLSLGASVWLAAELVAQRRGEAWSSGSFLPPVHHVVIAGAALLLLVMAGVELTWSLSGPSATGLPGDVSDIPGTIAWLAAASLAFAGLWERGTRHELPALFVLGIAGLALILDQFHEVQRWSTQVGVLVVLATTSVYLALAAQLVSLRAQLARLGTRCGMPDARDNIEQVPVWLTPVTVTAGTVLCVCSLVAVLDWDQRWMRYAAAFCPAAIAFGFARLSTARTSVVLQTGCLVAVSLAAILLTWSDMEPGITLAVVLERCIRLMMVFATLTAVFAITARKGVQPESSWYPVLRRASAAGGGLAIATLLVVLGLEAVMFEPETGVPFTHPYQTVAVGLTLLAMVAGLILLAVMPGRDPLGLSERGRMAYVYAAEFAALLFGAHLYATDPARLEALRPYWPYAIVAIAFAGVGLAEILERRGWRVLAEPMRRTGAFLPLLPALGWWAAGSVGFEAAGDYSILLLLVGLTYAVYSALRRSFVAALMAGLAGNGALWALMANYETFAFNRHPQLWLIPPAICVLAAAQIHARALGEKRLAAIRYASLLVVYASSTSEIFIHGVGDSLWQPMILATISVGGVLLGIALRIRAFLYLGSTFAFMSVLSMVWHAYSQTRHAGIWWAFGIVMGVAILTLFGVFEKKRTEFTRLVENLRQWEQ